jgi:hypothetical protein
MLQSVFRVQEKHPDSLISEGEYTKRIPRILGTKLLIISTNSSVRSLNLV